MRLVPRPYGRVNVRNSKSRLVTKEEANSDMQQIVTPATTTERLL